MRKLKLSDAGKASKILKKLELRVDGKGEFSSAEAMGASLFLIAMENYNQAENEIAEFMSDLIGGDMTKQKFLELDLEDALPYFEELKQDTGLKGFFKLLGKLTS